MPSFTTRLSDGTMWQVNAPSREEAVRLARMEDAQRKQSASSRPLNRDEAQLKAEGYAIPEELMAGPAPPLRSIPQGIGALTTATTTTPVSPLRATIGPLEGPKAQPPPGTFPPPPREGSMLRPILEGGGATAGLAALMYASGGTLNPATMGGAAKIAAAMGLGGAAGSFLSEAAGLDPSSSPGEAYRRAAETAAYEPAAFFAGESIGVLGKMSKQRLAKLDTQLATLAQQYGIRLGVEDLSTRGFLRRIRNVVGKFPFVSSPYQEASKRSTRDVAVAIQNQFDQVAPLTADPFRVSKQVLRDSRELWEVQRGEVNRLYDAWRKGARASGVRFSPNITRERAIELLQESAERTAEFSKVNPITGEKMASVGRVQPDPLTRFARKISELADNQSIDVWDGLKKDLQKIQDKLASPHDRARVGALLEGLELDLRSTIDNADSARALQLADRYFKAHRTLFETATANRMPAYREGIFEAGRIPKATAKDVQDAALTVFNSNNRRAVAEFRALVGDQTFRDSVRLHLQDRFGKAISFVPNKTGGEQIRLNFEVLSKDLGLFDPSSEKRQALAAMLRGTGVEVRDIENVFRLAQRIAEQAPIDVSQFASRRAVMGGLGSAAGTFTPGANISGLTGFQAGKEALKAIIFTTAGRKLGKWLTDPRVVRDLTTAMSPGVQQRLRTAAMIRLGRLVEQQGGALPEAGLAGGLANPVLSVPDLRVAPRVATGAGQAMLGAALSRGSRIPQ